MASKRVSAVEQVAQIAKLHMRRAEFLAQGLCPSCGAEPMLDHVYCYNHLRYFRQYQRDRRKRLRREGICVQCGRTPAIDGISHCGGCRRKNAATHYARAVARRKGEQ